MKKVSIRKFLFTILLHIGFYRVWRYFNRNGIIILTLHGVMDDVETSVWKPLRKRLSRATLDVALSYINRYYEFIPIGEAVDMLTGKAPMRNHCMVVTFDDGYKNNVTHALPILNKYNIPSVIFPAIGHIENRNPFWFDRLDYITQAISGDGGGEIKIGEDKIKIKKNSRKSLHKTLMKLIIAIKKLPGNDKEIMNNLDDELSRLENKYDMRLKDIVEEDYWTSLVTWDELKKASKQGMTVGSHTVDHARLALLTKSEIEDQLKRSKEIIENKISEKCECICYPNGSYDSQVTYLAQSCGYRAGLTTVEGLNYPGDEIMSLKRIHLPQGRCYTECIAVATGLSYTLSKLKKKMFIG